jgi:hypothetical protein
VTRRKVPQWAKGAEWAAEWKLPDIESGRVRGLLCKDCNTAIGIMRDDAARLRAAAAYIEGRAS